MDMIDKISKDSNHNNNMSLLSDEPCRACGRKNLWPSEVNAQRAAGPYRPPAGRRERGEEAVLLCWKCAWIDETAQRFRGLKIKRRNAFLDSMASGAAEAAHQFFEAAFPEFRVTLRVNPDRLLFEKEEATGRLTKSALKT